eukprot:TRINITY_DN434_c0_g2_i1.p2 TRINITY_DN434_c0_g2~~TRINITY_DN434_c0_g2_i1.p2  ORF type:complete len:168 (-),score=102.26 TRINITY_DN434_c0_g2_i1:132-635(-)
MKIFRDVFAPHDEMGSDSYPIKVVECMYEIEGKTVVKSNDNNFDIGANDLEGETETYDSSQEKVINFVDAHRLYNVPFDKKSYMTYIKGYMKNLKTYLENNHPERVAEFQSSAQSMVKKILSNFSEYSFYSGENMDADSMIALVFYKEDGITPYMYIWRDGINEEKV